MDAPAKAEDFEQCQKDKEGLGSEDFHDELVDVIWD